MGAMAALVRGTGAQVSTASALVPAETLANDPQRPQFHLLPARNWMNDPNGPIYYNGKYHMFFQYNPHAAVWGDMSWYHSVSPDMVHWTHLPMAMTPTPGSPDAYGCFSGSAIQVGKRVYFVYTGTKLSTRALATIRDGEDKIQESQCLAYSDDPQLLTWTKLPEPVIPLPPPGMKITGFRDPSAWKQGDWYYMSVGSGVALQGGCVLLYRSKDLKQWEYLHPLVSGQWDGKKTANPCDDGEMWECPEFFALDGGHVLIYSTQGNVYWQSGKLDVETMLFHPVKQGELDLGAFYAPKTQRDATGRRILWGWIQEKRSEAEMRSAGWSGMMSLPRVMELDADGTLRLTILPQMSALRAGSLPVEHQAGSTTATLPKSCGEMLYTVDRKMPFQLTIHAGELTVLRVLYTPESHSFHIDSREIPLSASDIPALHAFVDGSVIELIVSERIGMTKRFYAQGMSSPDIVIHAESKGDAKLNAWTIHPISNNRLTTSA